jgi:hypothetical protein
MALLRDWAATSVSFTFYSAWSHHLMVPTSATNMFDELPEVSWRIGLREG